MSGRPYAPLVHADSSNSIPGTSTSGGQQMSESHPMSAITDPFAGGSSRNSAASMPYSDEPGIGGVGGGGGGGAPYDPQGAYARRMAERRARDSGYGAGAAGAGAGAAAGAYGTGGDGGVGAERGYSSLATNGNGNGANDDWSPNSPPPSGKKKWIWAGIIALVIIAVAVGVGVGVSQGIKNGDNSREDATSSSGNGTSSSTNGGTTNGGTTNGGTTNGGTTTTTGGSASVIGSDPSVFDKDSRLHNSFWGIAYTTDAFQLPWCGATQSNVTRDIQLMSQLTTRIRLYGANCNQTAMVLQAIQDSKVDMKVYVAIYVDSNQQAFDTQLKNVEDALKTYGTEHVLGVTVGNEYLLNGGSISTILAEAKSVNTSVLALGLDKHLPIGTSDAGSEMSVTLGQGIDYFHANVHAWFAEGVGISTAAVWTHQFYLDFDYDIAQQASNKPDTAIAETGWPTKSLNTTTPNKIGVTGNEGAPTVANLQTFLDTFVCAANNNGTQYFFFEAFDEPWKAQYGGVEPYWGLFDEHRVLKDIKIPQCSHT